MASPLMNTFLSVCKYAFPRNRNSEKESRNDAILAPIFCASAL